MATIEQLRERLAAFRKTQDSALLELQLEFSRIVLTRMRQKGWTQKQLAHAADKPESYISRVIHAEANLTLEAGSSEGVARTGPA